MRKFYLTNAKGKTIDLQSRSDILLYNQTGLGYVEDANYVRIRNSYSLTSKYIKQHEIDCKLVFSGENFYKKYYDFVRFCQDTPLTLRYKIHDTFYLNVRLAEISKTQGVSNLHMFCDVKFVASGLFYQIVSRYVGPAVITDLPTYPYVYDDVYPPEVLQSVVVESDSELESPCKITIYGEATNPEWRHYVNSQLIEIGRYTGTIAAGHTLVIDSTTIPYSITEYDSSGQVVADRYAGCDFSTERFFHLQRGNNRISVSHDGTNSLALKVEGKIEYASV